MSHFRSFMIRRASSLKNMATAMVFALRFSKPSPARLQSKIGPWKSAFPAFYHKVALPPQVGSPDEIMKQKMVKRDGTEGPTNRLRGFIDYERQAEPYRNPEQRLEDWEEINNPSFGNEKIEKERKRQAARCMDCGTPFCQTHTGCPINNLIPEWNELVLTDQWEEALHRLHKTNNFPEFTGRVCPAPCEGACVAGLIDKSVTIKNIEYSIIEKGFSEGWVKPRIVPQVKRSGLRVAVIGSGPAGLSAADCLNQMGHTVTIFEREDRPGGLLSYGIPNMKLGKDTVQRRLELLEQEGVNFVNSTTVGFDISAQELQSNYHAVVFAVGATKPRDLPVPGRDLKGIHFAMEFLTHSQKRLFLTRDGTLESNWDPEKQILASGKNVVVIGGGDTGTDCVGTSLRQRCNSLVNFELLEQPPESRAPNNPWPEWPKIFRIDYGHEEAATRFGSDPREYQVKTTSFLDDGYGNVKAVNTIRVQMKQSEDGRAYFEDIPGTEQEFPADLVILAMGFVGPEQQLVEQFGLQVDAKTNIIAPYVSTRQKLANDKMTEQAFQTSVEGIFAAGDCRRGQSLVVWAIHEGRSVADRVHAYLSREDISSKAISRGAIDEYALGRKTQSQTTVEDPIIMAMALNALEEKS